MRNVHINGAKSDHLDWFRNGVTYQIFPDRFSRDEIDDKLELTEWNHMPTRENYFGGNLGGINSRAEYLRNLGVANIYLTPIFKAPANHRYDTQDYLQLEPMLGNEEDFRSLIANLQNNNIGLILDAVFNHSGDQFEPFKQALAGDKTFRDWFHFDGPHNEYQTVGGAQMMPQVNTGNSEVMKYFITVMNKWNSFGIRGWRLDVPWKTENGFFEFLKTELKNNESNKLWISEAWWLWEFDNYSESIMNYHSRNRILDFVHRHHADAEDFLTDLLQWTSIWKDPSLILNVIGSHDTARLLNMCDGDRRDALFCLAMNMFIPGVPMLYYGDEIAMEGENDPDCRRTFPREFSNLQQQFLIQVKFFTNLRSKHRALSHGNFDSLYLRNHALVAKRADSDCEIHIAINTNNRKESFKTNFELDWKVIEGKVTNEKGVLDLYPKSLAYFVKRCSCK